MRFWKYMNREEGAGELSAYRLTSVAGIQERKTWNRLRVYPSALTFVPSVHPSVRSVCPYVRPSMFESSSSIPALSTNGAEQDFSTFTYGVWITNLSNSHVDIKEDNINTTSIHRLQNLNVLLMRPPFPFHRVSTEHVPFHPQLDDLRRNHREISGKEESRVFEECGVSRVSETPWVSATVLYIRFTFAVHSWYRSKYLGWLIALRYRDSHLDTQHDPSTFHTAANMRQGGKQMSSYTALESDDSNLRILSNWEE